MVKELTLVREPKEKTVRQLDIYMFTKKPALDTGMNE